MKEQVNPFKCVASKMTEDGITNLTAAGQAGYGLLRMAVQMLKVFDHEGFEEYSKIKGNGSVFGEKTDESRRKAYAYAVERAGKMAVEHYNRHFTAAEGETNEGDEW